MTKLVGDPVERIAEFNADLMTLKVFRVPKVGHSQRYLAKGWSQGDEILLPATRFRRGQLLETTRRL